MYILDSIPSYHLGVLAFLIYYHFLSFLHLDFFFSIALVSPIFKYFLVLSYCKYAPLTLHL